MSEGTSQQADQPRRPRAAQGTRRTGSKQTKLLTPAALPAQEAAAPLAAPNTTGSPAPKRSQRQKRLPSQHPMSHPLGSTAVGWHLNGWKSTRLCSKTMQQSMRVAKV